MSVAKQAARGVAWNMLLGVSSRMLQLVGTLILTRFIAPDEYGAVLTASIAVTTAAVLTTFAFGQHLIAKRATPDVAWQAFVVHISLGIVAMGVVYIFRYPIGEALDVPDMGDYLYAYAIAHLLDRARYVPERLIMRALRFRTIAAVNASGEVAFTAVSLLMANRWGANAIIFGVLVRAVVTCVLFFRLAPREEWLAPTKLRLADVRDLFAYGLPIMIGAIADRAATRWDNFIMTKLFDAGVMGRYNLAYSLAEMPVNNIAEQIGEVLMPSFSRMDDAQRRRAVVRAPYLMGVIVSPLGVGLGAVSTTVVATFFNEKWQGMGPMLAVLSTMTVFRPMTWSAIAYCQAVQQTRIVMFSSFLRAIVVLALVAICGHAGGPLWACVGGGIGYALHSIITIIAAGRLVGFPVGEYLVGVARPLLPCIPMFLAVMGVEEALTGRLHSALVLGAEVITGAIVYIISAFILVRPAVNELIRLGREAIGRRSKTGK
jgi:PST family polysaccharide transporter